MTETPFIGQYWTGDLFNGDNTCWCIYGPLYVAARGGFFYFMNFRRWFEWMDRSIWWERSLKIFEVVQNFQHEIEIIVTTKSSIYDWIIEGNIWVTSLANIIRVEDMSHNLCLPKRHRCMECSSDIIEPCWRWWDLWCCVHNFHYIFEVYALETIAFTLKRAPS